MLAPKELFQEALQNNYHLAKNYHQLKVLLPNSSPNKQPIVIHQMGKVASTAIYESFQDLNLNTYSIYHTHYLSDSGLSESERFYKDNYNRIRAIHTPLIHSYYVRRYLNSSTKHKLKVITLVRDPVAKNVSSFFQNLEYLFGFSVHKQVRKNGIESILKDLDSLFLEKFTRHDIPLRWFDSEVKTVFNIDVFATPFMIEKGYQIYESECADVLLLKLEVLDKVLEEAFSQFLGIKRFKLKAENVGDDKKYAQVYKSFKKAISLPEDYLDKMYSSKYARHFYSDEEIASFRSKWKRS